MPRQKRLVRDESTLRARAQALADELLHRTFGYRRIWALLFRDGLQINHKSTRQIMKDLRLSRRKLAYKPQRPKRVEKVWPERLNQGWQIGMTSFAPSGMTPLFLVTVVGCCTRKLGGWMLERHCRTTKWTAAVRAL